MGKNTFTERSTKPSGKLPRPPKSMRRTKQPYKVLRAPYYDNSQKYHTNGCREVARRKRQIDSGQLAFHHGGFMFLRRAGSILYLPNDPVNVQTQRNSFKR